jgi:hypothetical protein
MSRTKDTLDRIKMALALGLPISGDKEVDYHIRQAKRLRVATSILGALAYRADLQGDLNMAAEAALNLTDALIQAWKSGDGNTPL